jgi:hypothetical protein
MKRFKGILMGLAAASLLSVSGTASAHTIGIGSIASGGAGTLNIWMSTYTAGHGSITNEGSISMTLGATTVSGSFSILQTPRPAGLTGGSNFFYSNCTTGLQSCPGTPNSYNAATNGTGRIEGIYQGVQLSGMTAGT